MTSSAAAGVYLERHVANLRLGMTLELFTAIGALVGGSIAFLLRRAIAVVPVRRAPPVHGGDDGPRSPDRAGSRAGHRRRPRPAGRQRSGSAAPGDPARTAVGGRLPRSQPRSRRRRGDRRRRGLRAPRDRWRDHQGAADAPGDGGPAAGRHGHQQHDDRHHRGGQRGHLHHPRRDRPVRRRARPAIGVFLGATAARGSATASTCATCGCCSWSCWSTPRSRCCCGTWRERQHPADGACRSMSDRTAAAERLIGRLLIAVTYVAVGLLAIGVAADDRQRDLAAEPGDRRSTSRPSPAICSPSSRRPSCGSGS